MEEALRPGQFLVRSSPRQVESWSVKRLPFEPKGWLLDLRDCIRRSVLEMSCASNELVEGLYTSTDEAYCDTENILFYNVGTSYFRRFSERGLRFKRSFDEPPQPPRDVGHAPGHHVLYRIAPVHERFVPPRRTVVTCWAELGSFDIMEVWLSVRRGESVKAKSAHVGPFGVSVTIDVPPTRPLDAASVMKPVLDGLLSALHFHDGSMLPEVARRIGGRLGISEGEVAGHLMGAEVAVLGERRLVYPRGQSVQWNPADDLCVAAEVLLNRISGRQNPALKAELFAA